MLRSSLSWASRNSSISLTNATRRLSSNQGNFWLRSGEISFGASGLIEAHERLDVIAGWRPPVGTTRQRRQNLCRTGGLFTAAGGLAEVYPLAAGRGL